MPEVRKPRVARTKPRIEDTEPKGSVRKDATHRGNAEFAEVDGFWEITCQASELVPVAQYASVTVGPVAVKRRVVASNDMNQLKAAIKEVQEVIYEVIAEDREMIEESVRLHNQKEAEAEAKGRKK